MVVKELSTPEKQQRFSTVSWQVLWYWFSERVHERCNGWQRLQIRFFKGRRSTHWQWKQQTIQIAADFLENLADNSDAKFYNGTPEDARNANPNSLFEKILGGPGS